MTLARDSKLQERPAAESFWPRGVQEWIQFTILAAVFFGSVLPAIAHYWLDIQRLGGFWHCLKIFLAG